MLVPYQYHKTLGERNQDMIKILFVCYGNICRSPMAEFIMKDLVKLNHLSDSFHIASAATSREEIGNPVYPQARRKLQEYGISCAGKQAVQLTREDYRKYDYLIGMETRNIRDMHRILGGDPDQKVCRLLDFALHPHDIADPWYSGDFTTTYEDIKEGCEALLRVIKEKGQLKQ